MWNVQTDLFWLSDFFHHFWHNCTYYSHLLRGFKNVHNFFFFYWMSKFLVRTECELIVCEDWWIFVCRLLFLFNFSVWLAIFPSSRNFLQLALVYCQFGDKFLIDFFVMCAIMPQTESHYATGLKILNQLVSEMNQVSISLYFLIWL